jgi:hypothetical protein
MFVRSKLVKGVVYYALVEGIRDEDGLVWQRTLASLGTSPTIQLAIE